MTAYGVVIEVGLRIEAASDAEAEDRAVALVQRALTQAPAGECMEYVEASEDHTAERLT